MVFFVSIYQILSCFIALYFFLDQVIEIFKNHNPIIWMISSIVVLLVLILIIFINLLFLSKSQFRGNLIILKTNFWFNVLQLLNFSIFGWGYNVFIGLHFFIKYSISFQHLNFGFDLYYAEALLDLATDKNDSFIVPN
jgi:hypothetical protein